MIKKKKLNILRRIFLYVCDQTLFIWLCDHERIPLQKVLHAW